MLTNTKRFRGPFNLWMQSTAVVATATFLSAFVMTAPGCGDDAGSAVHQFDTSGCAQGLAGEAQASAAVREGTPIRSYAWSVTAEGINLDIKGDGDSELGKLRMEADVEEGQVVGRVELTVGGEVVASQKLTTRSLNGGRTAVRADNKAGEHSSTTWYTFGSDAAVERLTVGAPASGSAPYPADVQVGLDGAWKTFDVVLAGNQVGEDVIKQWVGDNLADLNDNPNWALLIEAANDQAWQQQAEGQAQMCKGGAAQEAEGVLKQGLSTCSQQAALAVASDITGQRYAQSSCQKDDSPLGVYGRIANVLGAVVLLIGVVVAFEAGLTVGLPFAIAGVAVLLLKKVAEKVVEKYVELRKDHVVKRLGQGGHLLIDGSGDRDEGVESFFGTGGGGGGGGGCSPFLQAGDSCSVSDAGKQSGKSTGDPHLDTFDGKKYDLQAAGEFVLARARTGSAFEVQARQQPFSGICSNVTGNKAVAARVGSDRVAFYVGEQRPLHVEGKAVDVPGGVLLLPGGGAVRQINESRFVVSSPGGDALLVSVHGTHISAWIGLSKSRQGQVEGLLGNYDGDPDNDIIRADGTLLPPPVNWEALRGAFADSWRVTAQSSLFDYESGEDPSTFVIAGFPETPAKIDSLPADVLKEAETACASVENQIVKEDCILDVACTGDKTFVDATEGRDPKSDLALEQPVYLTDWTQEGATNAGLWTVSEDGRSVLQAYNGQPTFFVSPDDHFEESIRGRFTTPGGDDDYMGFVFGYQGPLAANGDPEDEFHTWLLAWKGADQASAPAGLTLVRIDGVGNLSGSGPFWTQTSDDTYKAVASSYSKSLGWRAGVEYDFELVYTKARVIVRVNGSTVFDLTAADAGVAEFTPGRFGFYNYSQPNVTYSNFSAAPATAQPPYNPLTKAGLLHHFDAAKGVTLEGDAVTGWSSGSAVLVAPSAAQRPKWIANAANGAPAIRFDGVDDVLESLGNATSVDELTVFVVTAPKANKGDFAGIISARLASGTDDFNDGFNIDLGGKTWASGNCATSYPDPLDAFNTINVETAKWFNSCGTDYFSGSLPFGEFHLLTVESSNALLDLRVDGAPAGGYVYGNRPFKIYLGELRVGARYHQSKVQGFFDGDIAEVLIYDRPLSIFERGALEQHLLDKYGI